MRHARDGARTAVADAMTRLLDRAGVTADSRVVSVRGGRLHYLEAGRGPVVVLVHGAGGGAANWFGVIGRLASRHRVLAPDLPGFGLSDRAHADAPLGRWTADLIRAWLDRLGAGRYDVVGTSFGGLVALRLAQLDRERVRRLALIDAVGLGRDLPIRVRLVSVRLLGRWILRPTRRGTRSLLRRVLTSRPLPDPMIEDALVEYLYRSAAAADPRWLARAYRLFGGWRGQRERLSDAELEGLTPRSLILWGERDTFVPPSHARRAAHRIPRSVLWCVPGAGHSPNWEAPGVVSRALSAFLADPPGPT